MVKPGLYIVVFIILCSFANYLIDYTIEKEINNRSPYYLSFASIGAISLESRLDCWAKINTTSTSQKLKQDMLSLLYYLDIPINANQIQIKTNQDATILQYEFTQNQKQFEFLFCSNQNKNESWYMLKFSSKDKSGDIEKYMETTKRFRGDLAWQYHYQYAGEIAPKIDSISQQKILKVIMKNLDVKEQRTSINNNFISSTGFSPKIKNVIPAVANYDHLYNVEAQIKSDPKAGKTLVYIGSPKL
ncbi:MAG: YwmB family TATA-box binding protein [Syntrophomonas sp.]